MVHSTNNNQYLRRKLEVVHNSPQHNSINIIDQLDNSKSLVTQDTSLL